MIERDVIVVGAGPVGLAAALAVRALGRTVTVVEEGAQDRIRPGSRAIFIHRASLEILERMRAGLGEELARHGLVFLTKRTLYRGRKVYEQTYPAPPAGGLPAATNLPQVVTERVLLEAAKAAGVEFIWSAPVTGASAGQDGVDLRTSSGEPLRARYVIAADGARSSVRESVGRKLEGPRTTNAFVIVDVREDEAAPLPKERIFHYEHPAAGGRNVLYVPFAGHWRVDLQCNESDDPEAWSGETNVRRWLPKVMPAKYADRVSWVSTYIFRQAIADRFADETRRVLLVGEAAHIFAPFGARGLNSGIPDAFLAAAAVDKALRATSPEEAAAAVDHFAVSRRAAAERNRASSSMALRHLTAATPWRRNVRFAAAQFARRSESARRWMDKAPYGPQLGKPDADGMQY